MKIRNVEACMPKFAYVSDRYGMVDYNGSTYYAFETKNTAV